MKKIALFLSVFLIGLFVVSCGMEYQYPKTDYNWEVTQKEETFTEEQTKLTEEENTAPQEEVKTQETPVASEGNGEWRKFLSDYEAWVDEYIVFMNKYKANPMDLSLLSDYMKLTAELAEWSEDASKLEEDLTTAELLEYQQTLLRITNKLSQVAY